MIKTVTRIYKWIIISVILQMSVLAYFNYFYLEGGAAVKATMYEPGGEEYAAREVRIPAEAEEVSISFNGAYAGYFINGKLQILDIKNKRNKKSIEQGMGSISYFRWLPDRNMVIYSLSRTVKGKNNISVATYDVDSETERSYPNISGLPEDSKVVDIELSHLTNVVYVKVRISDSQAQIFSYDIMDNLKYIMSTGINTVIKETIYTDNLIYQDDKNRIFVRNGKRNSIRQLPFKNKMLLLNIDSEDKVYIGELNDKNEVSRIYYNKLDGAIDGVWPHIPLSEAVSGGNVVITADGEIFKLVKSEKKLLGVSNDRQISFTGDFVECNGRYLVSRENTLLKLIAMSFD